MEIYIRNIRITGENDRGRNNGGLDVGEQLCRDQLGTSSSGASCRRGGRSHRHQ